MLRSGASWSRTVLETLIFFLSPSFFLSFPFIRGPSCPLYLFPYFLLLLSLSHPCSLYRFVTHPEGCSGGGFSTGWVRALSAPIHDLVLCGAAIFVWVWMCGFCMWGIWISWEWCVMLNAHADLTGEEGATAIPNLDNGALTSDLLLCIPTLQKHIQLLFKK